MRAARSLLCPHAMAVIVTVPALETWRALLAPKRALPMLGVSGPLLFAQWTLATDRRAVIFGLGLHLSFVAVGPLAWRTLFRRSHGWLEDAARTSAMGFLALVVCGTWVYLLPERLGISASVLSTPSIFGIALGLFVIGSWGLARDIVAEMRLARAHERAAQLAKETELAQLLALRNHLDPHFLFNTLNAIAEWCRQDAEVAEQAILQLASLLRDVLSAIKVPAWPLAQELALLRQLLALHALRGSAGFEWRVDEDYADCTQLVPPMLLLPLAENALKHGPSSGHAGVVSVCVEQVGNTLHVTIENPGPYAGPRAGSDGLPLFERRLVAAYEGAARFSIAAVPGDPSCTRATLVLPALAKDAP